MPPENDIAPHIKTIIENVRSALSSVTLSLAGAEAEPPADRLKQLGAECDQALAQIRTKMKASVIEVRQLAERTGDHHKSARMLVARMRFKHVCAVDAIRHSIAVGQTCRCMLHIRTTNNVFSHADATALAAQVESLRNEAATKNVRVKEVMDALHSVLLTLRTWQDAQTPAAK